MSDLPLPAHLVASARGYLEDSIDAQSLRPVILTLPLGASVDVRVVDSAGAPVSKVQVLVDQCCTWFCPCRIETSDADGRVSFDGLTSGPHTFAIHPAKLTSDSVRVTLAPAENRSVRLIVSR